MTHIPLSTHHDMIVPEWLERQNAELTMVRNTERSDRMTQQIARLIAVYGTAAIVAVLVVTFLGAAMLKMGWDNGALPEPIETYFAAAVDAHERARGN